MYTCEHFSIEELVSPEVYSKYGDQAWRFFDARILKLADHLRSVFGSATINDWRFGGQRVASGFRAPDCSTGAVLSAHKRGCAFDMIFKDATAEAVRDYIREHGKYLCTLISADCIVIESTLRGKPINWLHVAIENMHGPVRELHL